MCISLDDAKDDPEYERRQKNTRRRLDLRKKLEGVPFDQLKLTVRDLSLVVRLMTDCLGLSDAEVEQLEKIKRVKAAWKKPGPSPYDCSQNAVSRRAAHRNSRRKPY